jgi:hypothetical protein
MIPDDEMMAVAGRLARFLETCDETLVDGLFSDGDVTIVENFPPHVFHGGGGLALWRVLMRQRVENIKNLRHSFGITQDFTRTDEGVYFSLPTRWSGTQDGREFTEQGGWGFVLVREDGVWRIRSYAWALVDFRYLDVVAGDEAQ